MDKHDMSQTDNFVSYIMKGSHNLQCFWSTYMSRVRTRKNVACLKWKKEAFKDRHVFDYRQVAVI